MSEVLGSSGGACSASALSTLMVLRGGPQASEGKLTWLTAKMSFAEDFWRVALARASRGGWW